MLPVFVVDDYPIKKGDRIKGDISLASAFVDEIVFVNFTGSLTPIVYMSNTTGAFASDDGILTTRSGVTSYAGKLISGSISSITVDRTNRSSGQFIGDRLKLVSNTSGIDATASVLSVSTNSSGEIDFVVQEGGFGYVNPLSTTATNAVGISNQVLIITQNSSPTIRPGSIITCYDAAVTAPGRTFAVAPTPINGSAVVIRYAHPLAFVRTLDNASRTAALSQTVSSGTYAGVNLILAEMLRTIAVLPTDNQDWDIIFESIAPNGFTYGDITHTNGFNAADVTEMQKYINGTQGNAAYRNHIEEYLLPALGIFKQFNQFPVDPRDTSDRVIADMIAPFKINGVATGSITTVGGYNSSASYEVSAIDNTEYVTLVTDQIGDYKDVTLTSIDPSYDYGMSGPGTQNINSKLKDAFTPLTVEIGSIASIKVLSSGSDYESDVYSKIEHANISKFNKKDIIINFSNTNLLLRAGDIVTQLRQVEDLSYAIPNVNNVNPSTLSISGTGGPYPSVTTITLTSGSTIPYTVKAKLLRRDGDDYYFRQLSFYDFNVDLPIVIDGNQYEIQRIRYDEDSAPMGANATISGFASYNIGQIESVATVSSGYRYKDGETVDIVNNEPSSPNYNKVIATATIRTQGSGKTAGTWKTATSFLSERTKRIQDSDYYQEYSYEVSSIIDPAKYEPLIADTIGVAGTKIFSSPLINSINDVSATLDAELEIYTISLENLNLLALEGEEEILVTESANPLLREPISLVVVELDQAQNL
jgi:hypothetical protein